MNTSTLNIIGIDKEIATSLAADLNTLLANFQLYYQNIRGLHWNIKGRNFFELHTKFEELYTAANETVDEIAERVLTLEAQPLHTLSDYLETAEIKQGKNITTDKTSVELVVDNLSTLLRIERVVIEKAAEAGDEGTVALLSELISTQEKTIWMFSSWLR
ncbi:Dps family protein [Flammeovirga kamogawensis]|uniref:DNA starvation/stationary phase protection protein n=1 Tax=Flammeovirga kamogawensis TaxID=373891 RepID=A0ABX8GTH2_9BACT|nr:DNA starvation/stationary phase protection protein [Flammeovirga kamogawensis]MBB6462928.1 starvation-inducible DNA-binding protein [Flammeovirga kamogawensis]QWG06457.1 DNA starvation/stationary phase protection protein [Flammeovirga kamogawensis]TRX68287.1 DNA starvation/stationary phase protection protein [Flammeovirga kamogawensis]